MPFNTAGLDSVFAASTDTLWIALVSREDQQNSTPTNSEYIIFNTTTPYLSINYSIPDTTDSVQGRVLYSTTRQPIYDKTRIPLWK